MTEPDLLPIQQFYSFDASAFSNGPRDLFRPPTFEPIWDAIGRMIATGQVLAVDEVKRELKRQDDDVSTCARTVDPAAHGRKRSTQTESGRARRFADDLGRPA